jgi:phosphoenolpyruvate-protein kinase (PTS system EI component)
MCTLGVDRESERVADLFDPLHPAVRFLLGEIASAAKGRTFLAAAGEIAQNPQLMEELVELGYEAIGISLPYLGTARSHIARLEEDKKRPG